MDEVSSQIQVQRRRLTRMVQYGHESSTTHGETPVRWQARELVHSEGGRVAHVSTRTDVWAFGMLCLEILTGRRPYNQLPRDSAVIAELGAYRLPERPRDEESVSRGLTDQMWTLMLHCWNWSPEARPTMTEVKMNLKTLSETQRSMTSSSTILEEQSKMFNVAKSAPRPLPSPPSTANPKKTPTLVVPGSTFAGGPSSAFTGGPLILSNTPPRDLLSTPPRSATLLPPTPPSGYILSPSPASATFPRISSESAGPPRLRAGSSSSTTSSSLVAPTGFVLPSNTGPSSRTPLERIGSGSSHSLDRQYSGESLFEGSWSPVRSTHQRSLPNPTSDSAGTRPSRDFHRNIPSQSLPDVREDAGEEGEGQLINFEDEVYEPSNSLRLSNLRARDAASDPYSPVPTPSLRDIDVRGSSASGHSAASSSFPSQSNSPFAPPHNRSSSFSDMPPRNQLLDCDGLDLTETTVESKSEGIIKT